MEAKLRHFFGTLSVLWRDQQSTLPWRYRDQEGSLSQVDGRIKIRERKEELGNECRFRE